MPQVPHEPSVSYTVVEAMGGLTFDKPVDFAVSPGETNGLFIVERTGRVVAITNLASPTRTMFLDITDRVDSDYQTRFSEGLCSMAFHPGYETNRIFFVTYTSRTNESGTWKVYDRLSRFQCSDSNPNQALPDSEVILINQFDEGAGHDFNDLQFGPDGYLYCSLGDEGDGGSGGDEYNNAQRIDRDFFSAIIRIDVDKRPGSLAPNPHPAISADYAIPPDNPFVGAASFNGSPVDPSQVRTEFWAVGFRNPWRMFLDSETGLFYVGDVGQWDREEINIVTRGGNYGWAHRQGTLAGPKGEPPPDANLVPPLIEVVHGWGVFEGFAIVGGVVYRGNRIPSLVGAYVFADYVTGNLWILRYDGANPPAFERLGYVGSVAGFGSDPRNGDVLVADHGAGRIRKLDFTTVSSGNIPQTLAAAGVFSDLQTLTPHPGIVPYDINVPFWSDKATKRRWFSIPDTALRMTFNPAGNWAFPDSTVWIKHFELELTNGVPESARRIETRILVKEPSGVYGVTYRWGDSTADAAVVPTGGLDESFVIRDGSVTRTQVWRFPGRSECLTCHTSAGGLALGFNTPQLNREVNYGAVVTNQLHAFSEAGYFDSPVTNLHLLRTLAHATNTAFSREYRVRSYLEANCAQCHQPGGSAPGTWDARIATPMSAAGILNGPLVNDLGDANNRVVDPSSTGHSVLLSRISDLGSLRMPPLGSRVLDAEAVQLVTDWIVHDLADYQSWWTWQMTHFQSTSLEDAAPEADPDGDGNPNYMEYLLSKNPRDPADNWSPELEVSNSQMRLSFPQVANRGFEVAATAGLVPPVVWTPLNQPNNAPFFSAVDITNVIVESLTTLTNRFFRIRVYEP